MIMNMSVWESPEAWPRSCTPPGAGRVLQHRGEWLKRMTEAYTALWWIPQVTMPSHIRRGAPDPATPPARPHPGCLHAPGAVPAPRRRGARTRARAVRDGLSRPDRGQKAPPARPQAASTRYASRTPQPVA